jgi:hypothetical protein
MIDFFDSISNDDEYNIIYLKLINYEIFIFIILMLFSMDPLLNKNKNISNFIKHNFVKENNPNLLEDINKIIDDIITYTNDNIIYLIKNVISNNKNNTGYCNSNLLDNKKNNINFNNILSCIEKILLKKKVWSSNKIKGLKDSIKIYHKILQLLSSINVDILYYIIINYNNPKIFRNFKNNIINFIKSAQNSNLTIINEKITLNEIC